MNKIIDYVVVSHTNLSEFNKCIKNWIRAGYQPFNPLLITRLNNYQSKSNQIYGDLEFTQVLVKYSIEEKA